MKEFNLSVYSPYSVVFKGSAVSLRVPAEYGSLGVLASHAPLIASLKAGKIIIRRSSGETIFYNSSGSGFIEVLNNKVKILLSQGE